MSLSRFYLPADQWSGHAVCLSEQEAHHCVRVQRHEVGDALEVFDGCGRIAQAKVERITKVAVFLQLTHVEEVPTPEVSLHLFPALIKMEAFEWLLEKAVEIGVTCIQPIITEHTVVHLDGTQREKKLAKWQRLMVESAKQCHTPFLPELREPVPFGAALATVPENVTKLIPALTGTTQTVAQALKAASSKAVAVVIGPEGDFTTAELAMAQQKGFQPVTLGPYILRAETAAVVALAVAADRLRPESL